MLTFNQFPTPPLSYGTNKKSPSVISRDILSETYKCRDVKFAKILRIVRRFCTRDISYPEITIQYFPEVHFYNSTFTYKKSLLVRLGVLMI